MWYSTFIFLIVLAAAQSSVIPAQDELPIANERGGHFNRYYLYTRRHPTQPQILRPSPSSVLNSDFSPYRDTAVIVHGHRACGFTSLNPYVKDAYLSSYNANVIVVDWEIFAGQAYTSAVASVPSVGEGIASFLNFLTNFGLKLNRVHLVGFDLGAHVVGFAGRNLEGKVARITGLSPSASRWGARSGRLCNKDAVYVEVIHTDTNSVTGNGISSDIGDVNFHANGGTNQPGCLFNGCDHQRAWELFAASLKYNHLIGWHCTGLQNTFNTCRGQTLHMGNGQLVKKGHLPGQYRVNTSSRFPF